MKPEYDPTKQTFSQWRLATMPDLAAADDLTARMIAAAKRGEDVIVRDGVLVSVTQARAEAASREAEYQESRRPGKKPKRSKRSRNRKEPKEDPQAAREEMERLSASTWIQPPPVGIPGPPPPGPYDGLVQSINDEPPMDGLVPATPAMAPQAAREELERLTAPTWIQPPPVGIPVAPPLVWKKPDMSSYANRGSWPVFAMGPDEQTLSEFLKTSIKAKGFATWHVIAGGPSARFILEKDVPHENTIVVNSSILVCLPSIWISTDPMAPDVVEDVEGKVISYGMTAMVPFLRKQDEGYPRVPRVMFGHHISPEPDDVKRIKASSEVWWHHSSTHAAMEVARACGAKAIVLWGVDYGSNAGHAVHSKDSGDYASGYSAAGEDKIFEAWQKLAFAYRNQHVRVVNASPESRLKCFDKIDPDDALRGRVPPAFVGT